VRGEIVHFVADGQLVWATREPGPTASDRRCACARARWRSLTGPSPSTCLSTGRSPDRPTALIRSRMRRSSGPCWPAPEWRA
jgi:hypothetical protein